MPELRRHLFRSCPCQHSLAEHRSCGGPQHRTCGGCCPCHACCDDLARMAHECNVRISACAWCAVLHRDIRGRCTPDDSLGFPLSNGNPFFRCARCGRHRTVLLEGLEARPSMCSLRTLCSWALPATRRDLPTATCLLPQMRLRGAGHLPCIHGKWSCRSRGRGHLMRSSSIWSATRTGVMSNSKRWILLVGSHTSTRFSFGAALHRLARDLGPGIMPNAGAKARPPVRGTGAAGAKARPPVRGTGAHRSCGRRIPQLRRQRTTSSNANKPINEA